MWKLKAAVVPVVMGALGAVTPLLGTIKLPGSSLKGGYPCASVLYIYMYTQTYIHTFPTL